jgi:hypothetical protein
MNGDEVVALAVYSSAALIALALYVRSSVRELRWARRRPQLR